MEHSVEAIYPAAYYLVVCHIQKRYSGNPHIASASTIEFSLNAITPGYLAHPSRLQLTSWKGIDHG